MELLGRLTLPDDRAYPVSSNLARVRASELAAAEAAADAAHAAKTDRAYNIIQLKDRPRIASLPFPSSVDPSEAAQQLTRSVKASLSDILFFCDERFEGLDSAEWVPGWERPLQRAFERAITPDKPTTAHFTTLVLDFFHQVGRSLKNGATGPEAFAVLLRMLSTQFDSADTGESYTKLHTFGVPNGTPFCDFSREFRVIVSAATGTERVLAPGAEVVLEVVRLSVNAQFPTLMPTL